MKNLTARRTLLIRFALWLLLTLAIIAAAALIVEWFRISRSMPDRGWNLQVGRLVGLVVANLVFSALLAAVAILYLWVRAARALPDLRGWHLQKPNSEFSVSDADDDYRLDDYLKQEERVFKELHDLIAGPWVNQVPNAYSRYQWDSVCNPETIVDRNWNRSLILPATAPVGGVLLLHGLSDSPYSLRKLGQRLHAEGYTVVWLRLPGHGTNPRALADVSWKDWTSAVKIAVRGLRELIPSDAPLILAGYSNGGALSVDYALSAVNDESLPTPDAVVLFSPMIGINPLARITQLYHTVALVSRNQKAQWSSINAEIDPFKYSSWPMNANVQAWAVTQAVERKLAALKKSGRMRELPPILAMQSVVDSSVVVHKLITVLFDHLDSDASELVLFDVNRVDRLSNLLNLSFEQSVVPRLKRTDRPYRLTVLRNINSDSRQLILKSHSHGKTTEQETDLHWPHSVVSLSHIAVPIPPDDPIYGTEQDDGNRLSLGSLSMRAEPGALLISNSMFVRCRSNPFYNFMEDRVVDWLTHNTTASPDEKTTQVHEQP